MSQFISLLFIFLWSDIYEFFAPKKVSSPETEVSVSYRFVSNSFRTTRFHFIPPIPTFAIIYNHPIVFLAARPKLGTPRSQKRTLKLGRETSDKTICSTDNEKWAWLQFQIESHFLSKALIRASFSSCLTHKSSNWASSKTFWYVCCFGEFLREATWN